MTDNVYERQGFGRRTGLGDRPALLLIDFVNGFADPGMLGGGNILQAIDRSRALLDLARTRGWPVAHTQIVYAEDGTDRNPFCAKVPALAALTASNPASRVVDDLTPGEGELVFDKTVPSAFFGTALTQWLISRGVDGVLVAGCTTSGCVRASVIDAMSWGFRVTVVRDCVGDRALEPHHANLFDMEQKYADVVSLSELTASLKLT